MKIAVIIPARYGSTRFPGKPLAEIAGQTMLSRVVDTARAAISGHDNISLMVATEDQRITDHCKELEVPCVITSDDCVTGSDRALAAIKASNSRPDFVINFQGDAPFTPPLILTRLIEEIEARGTEIEVITPCHTLSWEELDRLRENKKQTPFSGTTLVRNQKNGHAMWFSKQILPAIRKEEALRKAGGLSPVMQHIGIYGYRYDILEQFVNLPEGHYEQLEGLEQLRLLENGITVLATEVSIPADSPWKALQGGIDSPEDVARAEALLADITNQV